MSFILSQKEVDQIFKINLLNHATYKHCPPHQSNHQSNVYRLCTVSVKLCCKTVSRFCTVSVKLYSYTVSRFCNVSVKLYSNTVSRFFTVSVKLYSNTVSRFCTVSVKLYSNTVYRFCTVSVNFGQNLTQLLHHFDDAMESLTNNLYFDSIYLDFAKAFDKVIMKF